MRVFHVFKDYYPPLAAGITCYIADVATAAAQRGHEVTVHTAGVRTPRVEAVNGVAVHRHREVGRVLSSPLSVSLINAVRGADADVIHVHMPNPVGEMGARLNRNGVPIVASFHARLGRQRFLEPVYGPFRASLLGRAARVLVSTDTMARAPELAAVRGKVTVLSYGVSPRIRAIERDPGDRDPEHLRLLFVGRLVYYKGVDVLLRALASVPDADLSVIGTGPLRSELEGLAATLGVRSRVAFRGGLSDKELRQAYASHDVLVLPSVSRAEAFGLAAAEAMASGMPVITTELQTGTSWVNVDGDTGYVVAPGDAAALAVAIERLRRPEFRAKLGERARERADEHFDFGHHVDELLAVYEEAARARA